eukprot:SAG31_NODE_992_length_10517_cov_6.577942_8_plen_154_part_00
MRPQASRRTEAMALLATQRCTSSMLGTYFWVSPCLCLECPIDHIGADTVHWIRSLNCFVVCAWCGRPGRFGSRYGFRVWRQSRSRSSQLISGPRLVSVEEHTIQNSMYPTLTFLFLPLQRTWESSLRRVITTRRRVITTRRFVLLKNTDTSTY